MCLHLVVQGEKKKEKQIKTNVLKCHLENPGEMFTGILCNTCATVLCFQYYVKMKVQEKLILEQQFKKTPPSHIQNHPLTEKYKKLIKSGKNKFQRAEED